MTTDDAREFVANNHRAVMITRRSAGGLQTSPVTVGIDSDGKVVISSRETAYKVRNLRRHPTATLCVFTDNFFGPWLQLDGSTEIVPLPEAMDGLVDYYRRISGEHPDWDDYRRAMVDQRRVLIRLTIDHVGPTHAGQAAATTEVVIPAESWGGAMAAHRTGPRPRRAEPRAVRSSLNGLSLAKRPCATPGRY